MTAGQLAKGVQEADEQLAIHQERKAEIDGRYQHQTSLKEYGEELVRQKNFRADEIESTCRELDSVWAQLNETWEDRKQLLTQCYDLQVNNTEHLATTPISHGYYILGRGITRINLYLHNICKCEMDFWGRIFF